MAGSQVVTVDAVMIEKQRTGYQACSLSHFSDTLECQITAGSHVEIGGALFEFTALESITGWGGIANSSAVYIKLTVAGASVTASFTITAPTWSTSKQGWYNALERYIGGLYKDAGGNYTLKWLYMEHSGGIQSIIQYGGGTLGGMINLDAALVVKFVSAVVGGAGIFLLGTGFAAGKIRGFAATIDGAYITKIGQNGSDCAIEVSGAGQIYLTSFGIP